VRHISITLLVTTCILSLVIGGFGAEMVYLVYAASSGMVQLVSLGGYLGDTVQVIANADLDHDLILQVRRGDVLLNKSSSDQNMVVTRDVDIPLCAGESMEGIWTLCLDWKKGSPKLGQILDVAPPLSDWPSEHADLLVRLLEQIDKHDLWGVQYAQKAVWNITDNRSIVDSIIGGITPELLHAAKVKPNVYRVFPHLSNPLSEADGTGFVVPPELLGTGDIQVTLTWEGTCDLDLHVIDPAGNDVWWQHQPSESEGVVDWHDMCNSAAHGGPENIYWPTGSAPSGEYTVVVDYSDTCDGNEATTWKVTLIVNGEERTFSGTIDPCEKIEVVRFNY